MNLKAVGLAIFAAFPSASAEEMAGSIALLHPESVIDQRLGGDVHGLAEFIKATTRAFQEVITNSEVQTRTCFVVAFGRGYLSQGWIVGDGISDAHKRAFSDKVQNLKTPRIKEGFVAFEVSGRNSAAAKKQDDKESPPPIPDEWKQFIKKSGRANLSIDQILENVLTRASKTNNKRDSERG